MISKNEVTEPLNVEKKRFLVQSYLREKFKDQYTEEWQKFPENFKKLEAAIDFFYKLNNDNLNLEAIASNNDETQIIYKTQYNFLVRLLDEVVRFDESVPPIATEFFEQEAILIGLDLNQKLETRSLRDLHSQSSNLGVAEKLLNAELGHNEWLGEVDLERMLIKLGVKNKVHITRLNATDIGMILHFEREKHKDSTEPYTIPLLLNCGSSESLRSQGFHWANAMVKVDPTTKSITIDYKDSMPLHDSYFETLNTAMNFTEGSYQAFSAYGAKIANVETSNLQENGWSCGYHALHSLVQNPEFPVPEEPNENWQKFLSATSDSSDLRTTTYKLLLSDLEIDPDYFVEMQLMDNKMIRQTQSDIYELDDELMQHYFKLITVKEEGNLFTTDHLTKNYQDIIRNLWGNKLVTDRLGHFTELKDALIDITHSKNLSADAKIIALLNAFTDEYKRVVKTSNDPNRDTAALFVKSCCDKFFGVELGIDYYRIKPEGFMMQLLNAQLGDSAEKPEKEKLLPPRKDKIKDHTQVSKSEPLVRNRISFGARLFHSLDLIGKERPPDELPTLRKNKNFSRVGSMFSDTQFCYAEKPGGVEPGFRAIDLDEHFFAELVKILTEQQHLIPKDYQNYGFKELGIKLAGGNEELRKKLQKPLNEKYNDELDHALQDDKNFRNDLSHKQRLFAHFIMANTPGPHKKQNIKPGIQWLCNQVKESVDKNKKLSAWMYKLDYAENEKARISANKEALREFTGTRLARIFSVHNQRQKIVCINNGPKENYFVLACGWKNGLQKLKDFLHNGSSPDYNGTLVIDKNASVKYSKPIPGLGKNLIFGIAIGDRDGVGKEAQNKGIAEARFYGFDYGKPYEGEGVCPTLRDDFSFEDSYAKTPALLRSSLPFGVARHYMYRNYNVFYDTALSDRMQGVHLLKKMITGENPSEEVIKSYPGLRQELHHIQESISSQDLIKELTKHKNNCGDKNQLQRLIDTQIMQICTGKISHFDLYFAQIKSELIDLGIKNNVPEDELIEYMDFIDEMALIARTNNQHILSVFEQRLLLTSQEVDLIDKLEKYFSPTSVMSHDGTVFLNTMRITPENERIPFQLHLAKDGTYTLSTPNTEIANELQNQLGLSMSQNDKGLSCQLSPEKATQLMKEVEIKYNQKRDNLLIEPTYKFITLPNIKSFLNKNNDPEEKPAKISFKWLPDMHLSLQILVQTEKQAQQLKKIFPNQTFPVKEIKTLTIRPNEHVNLQYCIAELYKKEEKKKESVYAPLLSSGTKTFPAEPKQIMEPCAEISSELTDHSTLLMERFERLIKDKERLEEIKIAINEIVKPDIIEKLMQYNDKTLSLPRNIQAIVDENYDKIQRVADHQELDRSSIEVPSFQPTFQ